MQCGAIASARSEMPPRDYFTDEIRRQLSAKLGDEELFTGGLTIRATVDPDLQAVAARRAARRAGEVRPRPQGLPRAGGADRPGELRPRATRRAGARALGAHAGAARHRRLAPGGDPRRSARAGARIGVEGVPAAADGDYLAFADASWARIRASDSGRLRAAQGPDDIWDVGDVVLVKAVEKDGAFDHWSYRQIPAIQGGFMAMDTQTGPRPRDAGRLLLPVERLQPRHPGAAPARLVVQALRLCRRARQRLQPGDHRPRRPDRGGDRRRHLEAGELGQHLLRPDADAHRHRAVAQPDDRAHRPGRRHGHGGEVRRALRHLRQHAASAQLFARRGRDDALQDGRGLCRARERRAEGRADAGRPGAGPLRQDHLPPRPARLRGLHRRRHRRRRAAARAFQRRAGDGRDHRLPGHLDAAGRGRPRHQRRHASASST